MSINMVSQPICIIIENRGKTINKIVKVKMYIIYYYAIKLTIDILKSLRK